MDKRFFDCSECIYGKLLKSEADNWEEWVCTKRWNISEFKINECDDYVKKQTLTELNKPLNQ